MLELAGKVNLREVEDARGRNALHFAAVKGHQEVCMFLVEESGLDVNSASGEGARCARLAGNEILPL